MLNETHVTTSYANGIIISMDALVLTINKYEDIEDFEKNL